MTDRKSLFWQKTTRKNGIP